MSFLRRSSTPSADDGGERLRRGTRKVVVVSFRFRFRIADVVELPCEPCCWRRKRRTQGIVLRDNDVRRRRRRLSKCRAEGLKSFVRFLSRQSMPTKIVHVEL